MTLNNFDDAGFSSWNTVWPVIGYIAVTTEISLCYIHATHANWNSFILIWEVDICLADTYKRIVMGFETWYCTVYTYSLHIFAVAMISI